MTMTFHRQAARQDRSFTRSPFNVAQVVSTAAAAAGSVAGSAAGKALELPGMDTAKGAVGGLGTFAKSLGGSLTSNLGSIVASLNVDGQAVGQAESSQARLGKVK